MKPTYKHAYCIIAHHEVEILKSLVSLIDDSRNDIFIHLDAKSSIKKEEITSCNSNLFFIKRRKVYWGGFSQIQVELDLLSFAYEHGVYEYYHLLSGVDLPLKSQDYIHQFFQEHKGKELIGIADDSQNSWIIRRTGYYYLFEKHLRKNHSIFYWLNVKAINLQIKLGIKRNNNGYNMKMGPNWFSLTSESVRYILSKSKWIKKRFRFTFCTDEVFIPTLIWNSPFRGQIFNLENQYLSCMRKIDWERGKPYTWKKEDFMELINSVHLFARKFSYEDMEIVSLIKDRINNG